MHPTLATKVNVVEPTLIRSGSSQPSPVRARSLVNTQSGRKQGQIFLTRCRKPRFKAQRPGGASNTIGSWPCASQLRKNPRVAGSNIGGPVRNWCFPGIDCAAARLALRVAPAFGLRIDPSPPARYEKTRVLRVFSYLAGGEGFEPPLTESESVVLPLDDPPKLDRLTSSPTKIISLARGLSSLARLQFVKEAQCTRST